MTAPSPGYSITVRVETKPSSEATAQPSRAVAAAGAAVLEVAERAVAAG